MKHFKYISVFCITLLFATQLDAQRNANSIIEAVYSTLQKAKDYSVDANIKLDMPFIRMMPVNVKIYFKQKDKFKVESKSIAIVPRQGFDQIAKVLADTNAFTAIIQGNEKLGETPATIINVIPLSDTSDIILGKFWIDPLRNVILKSRLTTRSNGTIETEFTYGNQVAFGLPDKIIFIVDVKKFKVPKGMVAKTDQKDTIDTKAKVKENKRGKIFITLTNYQVNKGIPDSRFKK